MDNAEILNSLMEEPRNEHLTTLFGTDPLGLIHEYISKSNLDLVRENANRFEAWNQLFGDRTKEDILYLIEVVMDDESKDIIELPWDDEPDFIDPNKVRYCFCPDCNNLVNKNDNDEIYCRFCNES